MTQTNNLTTQPIHLASLIKPMLTGAGIGLFLISLFLFGTGEPNPAWGKFWMIKPLLMVPLAGAGGGAFYHFLDHLRKQAGWNRAVVITLSFVAFIIALWLGTVLGLNGTMWD